jgi:nucleoside-diphosphate-sugar epimerase
VGVVTKPVVLVTGAGGFIGGWVAEALYLSGWDVRAGISRWTSAARIARFPLKIVQCNVMDPASLDSALQGVDVVVHCARGPDEDDEVTKSGTRLLIESARQAGAKKLIFTSSVAVYGDAVGLIEEDMSPVGVMSAYGNSKRVAESVCDELATDDFPIVGIRPTLVYGPFSQQWSLPYVARFASGRWSALGDRGEGKCNLVYVGDLVRMIRFMIENDTGRFAVFNGNGPEVPTWNSYLERFNKALGFPPLGNPDPSLGLKVALRRPVRKVGKYLLANHRNLLTAVAARSPRIKTAMKKAEEDLRLRPNDDEMNRFATDITYSMDRAARIGFVPRTSVDEGIAMTAEWARDIGLVA